jgi:hypothetical protein
MDYVGGDGGYVKTHNGWRSRSEVVPCLGSRVLGGQSESSEERGRQKVMLPHAELYDDAGFYARDEWLEEQEQKVLGQLRSSTELYRGTRGIEGEPSSNESPRRQFKLLSQCDMENQSWDD